ncbi:MAG TPA: hypothetical protein VJT80_25885 [Steroidobacteraceae bacterium]|nr:hypothetical protein [Steroidobacteraceae bacterium]
MNIARHFSRTALALTVLLGAAAAFGQAKTATPATAAAPAQVQPETITIPLSRPGEPISMSIDILSARMEVIGEERKDVALTVTLSGGRRKIVTPSGAKMLSGGGAGLEISERDNRVSIESDAPPSPITIVARVPRRAQLNLSTTNDGEITVRDIVGDLELENINGPITATNITGSVIAESVNNPIAVGLAGVAAGGATSLSSLNGDITLTLPASAKAELHLDTSRGEIVSDFELDVKPSKPRVERNETRGGVSVRMEDVIVATVNGGGPVIRVKTLNGTIKIAKSGG